MCMYTCITCTHKRVRAHVSGICFSITGKDCTLQACAVCCVSHARVSLWHWMYMHASYIIYMSQHTDIHASMTSTMTLVVYECMCSCASTENCIWVGWDRRDVCQRHVWMFVRRSRKLCDKENAREVGKIDMMTLWQKDSWHERHEGCMTWKTWGMHDMEDMRDAW
jgi:hypothetical protein